MEKKPTSGLAVAALIMGIIALFSSFVPLLNLLSFPFVLLAIVFGGIGLWQTLSRGKAGKGLAIAGLVLGVLALLVTVVMYGAASGADSGDTNAVFENTNATEQTDAAGTQAAEPQAAEPAPVQEADYVVTIDGCRLAEDYRGEPVAVVTYTFTNNSDDATSFMIAARAQAFQNGVELDTAIGDAWDNDKWTSDIKTGVSTTVEIGYELDDMSDVTVEVSETFSWDDTLLAEQTFSLS